ncbi:uncharacterized protein Dana_GF19157 [Drosophila ananassae]|uniref:non-specific serine/threonine protein kinase n=1 Tax=Drosophila ananassae TaxID=7217 RepID=B3MZD3_DROAN|nr:death-associated protein kinase related isoform X1 [Drosophila ananassae]XP_032308315.1 death-associated protein kinase related isoform X1 [Drosophila ananassae]XP_032308316.1 death-associated protein kinase related isoform X1 [Drosophila ananassae]EDV33734.2 uncharacterized protein Dana_GF19157 [Drosophila ananassae]
MFTEKGIFPIGDGLLDIDDDRLKGLLVSHDINEIYEVEQTPFARGKFAAVRRAVHKNTGSHFAAKFLKRRRRAQSSDKEIKHEIAVLMLCAGEHNIVNLNAVHETRSDTALLLELATGGELQTILDNEECLTEVQARHCMREVLKALKFLHDRSIAHLDLKPQNILLAGERIEDGLKLCDFGISRVVCEGINVREMAGTPDYVAPEVLQYEPLSLLTDIWSVGVLTYVLLSGFSPFGGDTKQETFLNISQCALTFPSNLFGGVSPVAIDFIRRALRIKPNDRMSAAGCLEHVWLKDDCSLDRTIFLQPQSDAEEEEDDVEDVEEEEEEEEVVVGVPVEAEKEPAAQEPIKEPQTQSQAQQHTPPAATQTLGSLSPKPSIASKPTHNGHYRANSSGSISKIPIATSKLLSSPSCETTTAIHTFGHGSTQKPTQIVTPTRRASDSDKENTFTATFVKKPVATIQLGSSNGIEDATVVAATLTLFPDAPTTPKVIRKTPTGESHRSATSVKALVKKFQLEDSTGSVTGGRRSGGAAPVSPTTPTTAATRMITIRRASEPLTVVNKKQPSQALHSNGNPSPSPGSSPTSSSGSTAALLIHSQRLGTTPALASHLMSNANSNASSTTATSAPPSASASASVSATATSNSSSSGKAAGGASAASAHHLHHHHMHHHHHHHHHVVIAAKNAAAVAATNNMSLDQGIIC